MPTNKKCISIGIKTAYAPTCSSPRQVAPPWPEVIGRFTATPTPTQAKPNAHIEDDYKEICVSV